VDLPSTLNFLLIRELAIPTQGRIYVSNRISQSFAQSLAPRLGPYMYPICMTIAVYIRVSSPKGQKTDSQRAEVGAWINRQRIKRARWFEDRDKGASQMRTSFTR